MHEPPAPPSTDGNFVLNALPQPMRFLLAGGSGFCLYLLFASALRAFTPLPPAESALLARILSMPSTFVLQRKFTFRSDAPARSQLVRYVLLQLLNAGIVATCAWAGAHWLHLPDLPNFVLAGIIGVVVSYLTQAKLVFG